MKLNNQQNFFLLISTIIQAALGLVAFFEEHYLTSGLLVITATASVLFLLQDINSENIIHTALKHRRLGLGLVGVIALGIAGVNLINQVNKSGDGLSDSGPNEYDELIKRSLAEERENEQRRIDTKLQSMYEKAATKEAENRETPTVILDPNKYQGDDTSR